MIDLYQAIEVILLKFSIYQIPDEQYLQLKSTLNFSFKKRYHFLINHPTVSDSSISLTGMHINTINLLPIAQKIQQITY
jgi:hypothetical protein